jgi:hypothetical protein
MEIQLPKIGKLYVSKTSFSAERLEPCEKSSSKLVEPFLPFLLLHIECNNIEDDVFVLQFAFLLGEERWFVSTLQSGEVIETFLWAYFSPIHEEEE